ncbi:porin family protein, partial [Marilutibacter aestuarii]
MKIRLLSTAMLAGLAFSQVAGAQDFDDRWYLTGGAGFNIQDNERGTRNAPFVTAGVGKFISEKWSLDGELNYQNPNVDANQNLNWSQYGISFDLRRHFIQEGRNWAPYFLMGMGYQRAEEEYDAFPSIDSPGEREDGNIAGKIGLGVQGDIGTRAKLRAELAYRADMDDQSVNGDPDADWFGDVLASVGVVIPLGTLAAPVAPVAPVATCADMDDDGDGVNNCDDKCPGSQAGQTIGPDG